MRNLDVARRVRLLLLSIFLFAPPAMAQEGYESVRSEYPTDRFIVGVGETFRTENALMDERVSEIRARLSIARQVKLKLGEDAVERTCEGRTGALFKDRPECRDAFKAVIDEMVEGFKEGSTVIGKGQRDGVAYVIAVLPRLKAARELNIGLKGALDKTLDAIGRAKRGDMRYLWRAREEYVKALVYAKEKDIIEGKTEFDEEFFSKVEEEILKAKKSY